MTTEVRASHLLVQTEEEAKKLREEILNGKKFEDVAAEVSMLMIWVVPKNLPIY